MTSQVADENDRAVRVLYGTLIEAWNQSDARGFAALFEPQGVCIGFDGSEYTSTAEIESSLHAIFKAHKVARWEGAVPFCALTGGPFHLTPEWVVNPNGALGGVQASSSSQQADGERDDCDSENQCARIDKNDRTTCLSGAWRQHRKEETRGHENRGERDT